MNFNDGFILSKLKKVNFFSYIESQFILFFLKYLATAILIEINVQITIHEYY
jgi:hypothetical protein